jgi:hypothetical protein
MAIKSNGNSSMLPDGFGVCNLSGAGPTRPNPDSGTANAPSPKQADSPPTFTNEHQLAPPEGTDPDGNLVQSPYGG